MKEYFNLDTSTKISTRVIIHPMTYVGLPLGLNAVKGMTKRFDNAKMSVMCAIILGQAGLTLFDLQSKSRKNDIVKTRNICMYIGYSVYKFTFKDIGIFFNRDHSTVMNSCNVVRNLSETDYSFRSKLLYLIKTFSNDK